jgi:DnaK suppressor protein
MFTLGAPEETVTQVARKPDPDPNSAQVKSSQKGMKGAVKTAVGGARETGKPSRRKSAKSQPAKSESAKRESAKGESAKSKTKASERGSRAAKRPAKATGVEISETESDKRRGTAKSVKPAKQGAALTDWERRLLKQLETEREALLAQAAGLEAEQRALAEDPDAAEMWTDLESGDVAATTERDRDLTLSANVADLLDKVEVAIGKLRSGTFGTCERCAKKIPRARLQAIPYAPLCVECQQFQERLFF